MNTMFPELATLSKTSPFAALIRTPDQAANQRHYDVPELKLEVTKFLALQIAASMRDLAPRMMVIAGPPGVGKSQGALRTALGCGFAVAAVSCSMFASEVEGGATTFFNDMCEDFCAYSAANKQRVVVILDDLDLSILARDDKTGVSSNTNLLTERLQYLADNRHVYRNYDGSNLAFIITVNNADALRTSLLREMRATWFEHDPSPAAKADIAFRILDPQTADERMIVERLIRKYPKEPIAFWSALRLALDATRLDAVLTNGLPPAHELDAALAQRPPLDAELLERLARKHSSSRIRNFLFKR